jgi:uncharacterized protein YlxP (DUF503 family)
MRPWLGVLRVSIEIPGANSLKDRRQVVRSLLERLKKRFNASCADLGPDETWNRADLAVVFAGSAHQETESRAEQCLSFVSRAEDAGEFIVLDIKREVFAYGDF